MSSQTQNLHSGNENGEQMDSQAILNQLRAELLDARAASLNRWLTAVALALTFFGVVIAIAGIIGYSRLSALGSEIENHLRRAEFMVSRISDQARTAEAMVDSIKTAGERLGDESENNGTSVSEAELDAIMLVIRSVALAFQGFEEYQNFSGHLAENGDERRRLQLPGAGSYVFVGGCDANCTDLDLRLYRSTDSGGNEVGEILDEDTLKDARPIVNYDAFGQEDVWIEIAMYSCGTNECEWQLQVYAQAINGST